MLLIGAPLTFLFALFAWPPLISPLMPYLPYGLLLQIIILVSLGSIAAGWYLCYRFIRHGLSALSAAPNLAWVGASAGLGVALLSAASNVLPKSEPYSPLDNFRFEFSYFSYGLLLALPLLHLWIERRRPRLSN